MKWIKRILLKKQAGFTLAEIMVAVGILGAVSVGVMHLVRIQSEQQVKADTDFEINTLLTSITQHMQNSESCKNTLTPRGNITVALNKKITQIKNASGTVIFEINKPYGGRVATSGPVVIESMQIMDHSVATPFTITPSTIVAGSTGHGQITLGITFRRDQKIITGLKKITHYIPLSVELNSAYTVTNCFSAFENALSSSLSLACVSIKGSFNPVTKECELTKFDTLLLTAGSTLPNDPSMGVSTAFLEKALNNPDPTLAPRFNMQNRYVNVTGDSMSGDLVVNANTTANEVHTTSSICVMGRCRDFTPKICPNGQVVSRIKEDGSIECQTIGLCPANNYFAGINPDGSIKCVLLNGKVCPASQYVTSIAADGTVTCGAVASKPAIVCPGNQYIEQISATGVPTCKPIMIDTNTNVFSRGCPAGQAVRGFTSTGSVICGAY